ncbi:MAG: NAD(P)/FAD-dependent oxidoreductase, partial [Candidatus Aenigmatarchaeota archaeon]
MSINCDVLVIGAGPAGSSAARAAALNGANVILIEKQEKPGKVACGEAISSMLFSLLPFKIPKNQLKWKLSGMRFYVEDLEIERKGNFWESYSIDRKKFDQWLAKEAVKAGAKLLTNTELIDLEHENYFVKEAVVKTKKEEIIIKPKILIAADGVESKTLKLLGLYKPKKGDIAEVYSWEMGGLKLKNPYFEQVYLGNFSDGGYAYIFPKSKYIANIGVGSMKNLNLKKCFEEFLELQQVKKQLKNAKFVIERSGKAPAKPFLNKNVYENVLITGDAACQNFKPYVEGILPGVICGDICGKTTAMHIKKNISLDTYPQGIEKEIGYIFKESNEITKILYDLFKMRCNKKYLIELALISNLFSCEKIREL